MPYCSVCGVEVDAGTERCPLCSVPIFVPGGGEAAAPAGGPAYPEHVSDPVYGSTLTDLERRRVVVEIVSVASVLAAGALALADLLSDGKIAWSLYAFVAIGFTWALVFSVLFLWTKPGWILPALAGCTSLFLLCVDFFNGRMDWFLRLGLPLVAAPVACVMVVGVVIRGIKRRGFNIVAVVLFGVAVFLALVEVILDLNANGVVDVYWSGIAALALAPTGIVLYYIHLRGMRGADLRKVFRL